MNSRATLLLLCILAIIALSYSPFSHIEQPPQETDMKFLALGDSYTIGESVAPLERWPVQLAGLLRERGIMMEDPEIIAKTGWTTDELMEAIIRAAPHPPYDLVTLLIGVNNQYRGGNQEIYREEFVDLLEQAIDFAAGDPKRVVVLSIPDWGVTPFGARDVRERAPEQISAEIAAFNQINLEETQRLGTYYVDITPISQGAADDLTLLASDQLHPSGKMYALWAEAALPVVREALFRP